MFLGTALVSDEMCTHIDAGILYETELGVNCVAYPVQFAFKNRRLENQLAGCSRYGGLKRAPKKRACGDGWVLSSPRT
jgi:hypothetical protein